MVSRLPGAGGAMGGVGNRPTCRLSPVQDGSEDGTAVSLPTS